MSTSPRPGRCILTPWWERQARDCFTSAAWGNYRYHLKYWGMYTPTLSRAFWQGTSLPCTDTALNKTARPCIEGFIQSNNVGSTMFNHALYQMMQKNWGCQSDSSLISLLWSWRSFQIHQASTERLSLYPQVTRTLHNDCLRLHFRNTFLTYLFTPYTTIVVFSLLFVMWRWFASSLLSVFPVALCSPCVFVCLCVCCCHFNSNHDLSPSCFCV